MHADSSSRGGTCARHRLSSALQTSLARALRIVRQTVSGFLQTETEKPALRAPPADLVCAGPSSRGLCGDVCSLAHAAFALAASLQRLAGAAEVGVHRRSHARVGGNEASESHAYESGTNLGNQNDAARALPSQTREV